MSKLKRASFGSKLGVILATAGSAVGLGNVWRFPYMTGQNGGAVFILIYVGCVLLLGIPCMISEFIIGRHAQSNTARAFRKVGGLNPLSYIGYMSVLTGFLITGYYAVVSGWCLQYIWASLIGQLEGGDPAFFTNYFTTFSQDPVKPIFWTFLVLSITAFVIVHGVRDGIERASKLMMPTLFILLLIIVGASCMLPDADDGIEFLFKPDWKMIKGDVFLAALGQSFYSMSIAMGCICTYARPAGYCRSDRYHRLSGGYPCRLDDLPGRFLGGRQSRQRSVAHLHHAAERVPAGVLCHSDSRLYHIVVVLCPAVDGCSHLAHFAA